MLDSLSKKQKIIFVIVLFIMVLFILFYIYSTLYKNNFNFETSEEENILLNDNTIVENTANSNSSDENITDNAIIVYICGAVKESKVISLKEDSRIADAIEAVGGLTQDADLTNINLAYILEDGEKIYIPKKGEKIEETDSSVNTSSQTTSKLQKININKASQTELETIPGIGPSTALKIINYRKENGKFSTIEDIKNVSGIGDAKYESMKDYICVK